MMFLTILGVYSLFMLILMSAGSVVANMKKGLMLKDFSFMIAGVLPIIIYVIIMLVKGW
ncbi:hypothetical protein K7887_22040 (plasmid) [Sutcliffiella horikoshii]|uniref:hypothetical protein n=1 Tax=Sutcliffiella horikoshii TaxID=79883 RepID=UPI001CBF2AEF|nr:hypothetical protein [Sutcliffiella horikoshii]UAL49729.1 hypothetical protein K7887_22040 [Sutcliffiella horikoshii]